MHLKPLVMSVPIELLAVASAASALGLSLDDATATDEALNTEVARGIEYRPRIAAFEWVIPSSQLPRATTPLASNNNVGIAIHEGRLYLAWRSAPVHFASRQARMYVVSSADWGVTWDHETTIDLRSDLREPLFLTINGRLSFTFFQAGTNPFNFEPKHLWRTEKRPDGRWSDLRTWGEAGEIVWDMKVRRGRAWRTSYAGDHYWGSGGMSLRFMVSDDGEAWSDVGPEAVYRGGVSESSFEFLDDGQLWAITRNEDGDASGFGSHLVQADTPDAWQFPSMSSPWRYDSPRMFKHGDEIYMIARRDPVHEYDREFRSLTPARRKFLLFAAYGLRPKRTTLYRIDRGRREVVTIGDLPGAGDTAFPSIVRLAPHTFLVANYTSPLDDPDRSWLRGQLSRSGTQIYLAILQFDTAA